MIRSKDMSIFAKLEQKNVKFFYLTKILTAQFKAARSKYFMQLVSKIFIKLNHWVKHTHPSMSSQITEQNLRLVSIIQQPAPWMAQPSRDDPLSLTSQKMIQ